MDASLFLRGLVLGFTIAAAVGPMAVLCMRRTLVQGQLTGLLTGLGIATADGCYALTAAFGLTFVSNALIDHRVWLELIGGAFLCYLGLQIVRSRPARDASTTVQTRHLLGAYGSALGLTLTNPLTILSFAALFAGLGLGNAASYSAGALLVLGVFLGSLAWWLFLTTAIRLVRHRLTGTVLTWINAISGTVILAFGALAIMAAMT